MEELYIHWLKCCHFMMASNLDLYLLHLWKCQRRWKEKLTSVHFHYPATVSVGQSYLGTGHFTDTSYPGGAHCRHCLHCATHSPRKVSRFKKVQNISLKVLKVWTMTTSYYNCLVVPWVGLDRFGIINILAICHWIVQYVKIYGYNHVIGMPAGASIGQACLLKPISWHTIGMYANAKIPT